MTPKIATEVAELDVVELRRALGDYERGTRGTVVSSDPQGTLVTVEFEDPGGEVDLIDVDRLDVALVQQARSSRLNRNGR